MFEFIRDLFIKNASNKEVQQKTIKDLDILDDVWIKDDDVIYNGWVYEITRRCIIVVYGPDQRDFRFRLEKPLNKTEIKQNEKILYCNKPENYT